MFLRCKLHSARILFSLAQTKVPYPFLAEAKTEAKTDENLLRVPLTDFNCRTATTAERQPMNKDIIPERRHYTRKVVCLDIMQTRFARSKDFVAGGLGKPA